MFLKVEEVESSNAVSIKCFSISDHFCKHAAQHFVSFFEVSCMWDKIHCFNLKNYCKMKGKKKGFPTLL